MKKFHFTSDLLVVAPKFAGKDFKWIDTFTGSTPNGNTERVNVLVFNVEHKGKIRPMLENELKKLEALETLDKKEENNKAYIEMILSEMDCNTYEHDVPPSLLEAISKSAHQTFCKNDVIYLSGISSITN